MSYIKFILSRSVVFYAFCAFVLWHFLDYNSLFHNAIGETMSRLTPPMDYFKEFVLPRDHYNPYRLKDCIYYHKQVAQYFPYQKAEALGMEAYCYAQLGKTHKAQQLYQESLSVNPYYFWPYYNLGVLAYQRKDYAQVVSYLGQGLSQDPVKTMVLLTRSKVYMDVKLSKEEGQPYDFAQGLKEGRHQAFLMMMDSLLKLKNYQQLMVVAVEGVKEGFQEPLFYDYAKIAAIKQDMPLPDDQIRAFARVRFF